MPTGGGRTHCGGVSMQDDKWRRLTRRERQIAEAASRGLLNKQIANELHVTEATVKFHLTNVFEKLGVTNRTQLVALMLERRDDAD
jgi:two-component system, NarL family, nitrate/nitrite response regulator NarP